jgi:DNA-binding MarR family transcriptional regulator
MSASLHLFTRLRELRACERRHLQFLRTLQDYDLVIEIGYRHATGTPLTVNEALRLDLGSVATLQRQLRRLRQAGVIALGRSPDDRRVVVITLTPNALKSFKTYADVLGAPTECRMQPPHRSKTARSIVASGR